MPSDELIELWKKIVADLQRARDMLPPGESFEPSMLDYQEYLDANELELACDMLEAYAEQHPVPRPYWFALRDAASKMDLHERAKMYERRAVAG